MYKCEKIFGGYMKVTIARSNIFLFRVYAHNNDFYSHDQPKNWIIKNFYSHDQPKNWIIKKYFLSVWSRYWPYIHGTRHYQLPIWKGALKLTISWRACASPLSIRRRKMHCLQTLWGRLPSPSKFVYFYTEIYFKSIDKYMSTMRLGYNNRNGN